jgi:hypothetical protein
MYAHRSHLLAAAALVTAVPVVAGCSNSSTSATTTTTGAAAPTTTSTTVAAASTTSTPAAGGPAVGGSGGVTLSVTSAPRSGAVGRTTITITAVLTGTVVPGRLDFLVSDSPSADQGQPATDQPLAVTGPGTYVIPTAFSPPTAGNWAAGVAFSPNGTGSTISLSGLPPHVGAAVPFPQLVTVVTG